MLVTPDLFSACAFLPIITADEVANCASIQNSAGVSGPSSETVSRWLSAITQLHRSSANSEEFFLDAASFVVETIGLDEAWILRRSSMGEWQIVAHHSQGTDEQRSPNASILAMLVDNPVAQYQSEAETGLPAVVVAPILGQNDELLGAIYALRDTQGENRRRGIRPLEARMIQLLTESVTVGIARLEQETAAARARVLLEQAFSPTVADCIQRHPECLSGQLREVTILFADLCGFTSLAESMVPADCYRLLGEVMETLTNVVIAHQGIVVDYYGDGLLAIWNAPLDQSDHADLACEAALGMLDALPKVSQQLNLKVSGKLELGIGVHSGPVLVGNAGTKSRLKYGPRGSNVNLASRVQAATRQLDSSLLITAATQRQLSNKFFTLRTCTARLPGLEQSVELFAVYPASKTSQVKSRLDQYAHALRLFEQGDLVMAEVLLSELVAADPQTPARFLAQQAASQRCAELGRRASDRMAHGPIIEIHEK
jgi:adenylate cyclase